MELLFVSIKWNISTDRERITQGAFIPYNEKITKSVIKNRYIIEETRELVKIYYFLCLFLSILYIVLLPGWV